MPQAEKQSHGLIVPMRLPRHFVPRNEQFVDFWTAP